MAEPFANVSDLEDRWRPLTPEEEDRASVLLDDASADIRLAAPSVDQRIADFIADPTSTGALDPIIPMAVACAMVKRVMIGGSDLDGVTSTTVGTGPFSNGTTYANPMGNLYLTKAERQRLGVGTARAYSIDPAPDAGSTYWPPNLPTSSCWETP
jgi:hypothetical protein